MSSHDDKALEKAFAEGWKVALEGFWANAVAILRKAAQSADDDETVVRFYEWVEVRGARVYMRFGAVPPDRLKALPYWTTVGQLRKAFAEAANE